MPIISRSSTGEEVIVSPSEPVAPSDGDLWVDSDEEAAAGGTAAHEHDAVYVNETDHTKTQHTGLGLVGTESDGRIRVRSFESTLGLDAILGSAPGSDYPLGYSSFPVTKASGWPVDGTVETTMVQFSSGMISEKRGMQMLSGSEGDVRFSRGWYPSANAWSPWAGSTIIKPATATQFTMVPPNGSVAGENHRGTTWDGTNFRWMGRLLAIATGRGSHWSTDGYYSLTIPADGTVITGHGGAASQTIVAAGIPIQPHTALYAFPTIGGTNTQYGYGLVSYTSTPYVLPDNAIFIAGLTENVNSGRLKTGWGDIMDYVRRFTWQYSWADYGGGYVLPHYRKDASGFIHLSGLANGAAATNDVMTTLPLGYRPAAQVLTTGLSGTGAMARIDIDASGTIRSTSRSWLSLDSIAPFYGV